MRPAIPFVTMLLAFGLASAQAHDTWVQTNTNVVRTGDVVHIDLMLGNHGNEHRDFKLAGKVDLEGCTLDVLSPDGQRYDLLSELADLGYAPKEGFWTARFVGGKAGLYTVAHTLDRVVNHGRALRSVKSSKAHFVLSPSLDRVPMKNPGFDEPLGHALELVADTNPVTPMGPGLPLNVKLLYRGKPLPETRVSFVPRGQALSSGLDEAYERITEESGRASFTPKSGNYYLIVAHVLAPEENTADYEATQYAATLAVYVPEFCPCCE